MNKLQLPKRYNGFKNYYFDSAIFADLCKGRVNEEEALRRAAGEFQYAADGFKNEKIIDAIIERYKNS